VHPVSDDIVATQSTVHMWVEEQQDYSIDVSTAVGTIHSGQVRVQLELGDARPTGVNVCGPDDGEVRVATLAYDLLGKDTALSHSYAEQHMPVRPALNQPALEALKDGHTMDDYAKVVNAKLARPTAPSQGQGAVPDMLGEVTGGAGGLMVSQLEELRQVMLTEATQADYGWRLWAMASVVCHAITLGIAGESPGPCSRMRDQSHQQIVLTAKLLYLRSQQLRDHSWWYIGDEVGPHYRAMMIMAGRGLRHYVPEGQETVYSRTDCEPEVQPGQRMIFTILGGSENLPAPTPADYVQVLSSPELALACYYDYARSVGVGELASVVLLQAMHGPHMWGARATLPYYPVSPRLDGMTTLLAKPAYRPMHTIAEASQLVANSPLVGLRIRVATGAGLATFTTNRFVDVSGYIAGVSMALRSDSTARALLATICGCLSRGAAGLQWLNPFRSDPAVATAAAIEEYRRHPYMLATFRAQPVKALADLFTSGVDMRSGVIGIADDTGGAYAKRVGIQMAAGMPASLKCERASQTALPQHNDRAWLLTRAWKLVCVFVCYKEQVGKPRNPPPKVLETEEIRLPLPQSGFERPAAATLTSEEPPTPSTLPALAQPRKPPAGSGAAVPRRQSHSSHASSGSSGKSAERAHVGTVV